MRYTLMHVSDLHAGPPFDKKIAEIVARQAHEIAPDLLVISGDFVQRATFLWQWRTITAYLKTLPRPQLVVPGNHDVPLFDGFSRLLFPLSYYQRNISPDLNPIFSRPGLLVVGGNSAHGLTMDGGRVNRQQLAALEQAFSQAEPDTFKVAVLHHPVADAPLSGHKRKIANSRVVMKLLERCEVDLFLCGHVHFSYIEMLIENGALPPGALAKEQRGLIICQCGTTTSRRGRGVDRGKNSFNLIEIDERVTRIYPHFYEPDAQRFVSATEHVFERHSLPAG